ncbi:hypothetical protein [Schumannella soli]|uniref:Uncharacterized protein n=1 Tax=Schumannella soli TaxID=2590779 RepID=A0A506Y8J0_9MICO|nr:hypothetical protein [Schumannella soli]TPW77388.1 hypothetical protein FJ657_01490 [Schumannella soli]
MTELQSRILGPIVLDGGVGGGAMEATIPFAGAEIAVRLEIDHPDRLDQQLIDDLDVVLDDTEIPDRLARDAIAALLPREGSAPAMLRSDWEQRQGAGRGADEFLADLRATTMVLTPDGGREHRDRVVLRYGVADGSLRDEITVRLPARSRGPEVDGVLRPRR